MKEVSLPKEPSVRKRHPVSKRPIEFEEALDAIEEEWRDILWPWEQQQWSWFNLFKRGLK